MSDLIEETCERCGETYRTFPKYANDEGLPNKCGKCMDETHKSIW